MNADQAITQAAAYAAVARSNGDEAGEAYWTERVTILDDQREAVRLRQSFDVLKGHPDHSGMSATEHAYIHSDEFTTRLGESIARLERRG